MDIALVADDDTFTFDLALTPSGADLLSDGTLRTPVSLSLFTDALAAADDILPAGDGDRRGTWMDGTLDASPVTDHMGSRDWLYARAKATNETRLGLIASAEDALAWMVEDGIAASVAVTAAFQGLDRILRTIVVNRLGPGGKPVSETYTTLWQASAGAF
jgi:phage gp46-like protein